MSDRVAITSSASKSLFRRECTVTAEIAAAPAKLWQLLTNAAASGRTV
jgi:hypothetical protein